MNIKEFNEKYSYIKGKIPESAITSYKDDFLLVLENGTSKLDIADFLLGNNWEIRAELFLDRLLNTKEEDAVKEVSSVYESFKITKSKKIKGKSVFFFYMWTTLVDNKLIDKKLTWKIFGIASMSFKEGGQSTKEALTQLYKWARSLSSENLMQCKYNNVSAHILNFRDFLSVCSDENNSIVQENIRSLKKWSDDCIEYFKANNDFTEKDDSINKCKNACFDSKEDLVSNLVEDNSFESLNKKQKNTRQTNKIKDGIRSIEDFDVLKGFALIDNQIENVRYSVIHLLNSHQQEINSLNQEVSGMKRDNVHLRKDLELYKTQFTKSNSENSQLQKALALNKDELKRKKAELEKILIEYKDLMDDKENIKKQLVTEIKKVEKTELYLKNKISFSIKREYEKFLDVKHMSLETREKIPTEYLINFLGTVFDYLITAGIPLNEED